MIIADTVAQKFSMLNYKTIWNNMSLINQQKIKELKEEINKGLLEKFPTTTAVKII